MQEEFEQPDVIQPEVTPYQLIGGDAAIRKLVDRFYVLMENCRRHTPRAKSSGRPHRIRQQVFRFLSGWLESPQRFVEKYGHPMLRRRHMPYAIGTEERDEWLMCMKQALEETVEDVNLRDFLYANLSRSVKTCATAATIFRVAVTDTRPYGQYINLTRRRMTAAEDMCVMN